MCFESDFFFFFFNKKVSGIRQLVYLFFYNKDNTLKDTNVTLLETRQTI